MNDKCAHHLAVTVEYDQALFEGPPRSVSLEEIRTLFGTFLLFSWIMTTGLKINISVTFFRGIGGEGVGIEVLERHDVNADPNGATPEKRWKVALDPCHEMVVLVTRSK